MYYYGGGGGALTIEGDDNSGKGMQLSANCAVGKNNHHPRCIQFALLRKEAFQGTLENLALRLKGGSCKFCRSAGLCFLRP